MGKMWWNSPGSDGLPAWLKSVVGLAAAMMVMVHSADGATLIVNGGFEAGSFTGWSTSGSYINIDTYCSGPSESLAPHSGSYEACLGTVGADGSLSQTISDTAGQVYLLSYWVASDGNTPSDFRVTWNGTVLSGSALSNTAASSSYVNYQFTVTATGTDTLTFYERNDPGYWALDDVSMTPSAPTP